MIFAYEPMNYTMNFGAIRICLLFTPPLSSSPVSCRAPRLEISRTYLVQSEYYLQCDQKKFAKFL